MRNPWALVAVATLLACSQTDPSRDEVAPERWRDIKSEIVTRFPDVKNLTTAELRAELDRLGHRLLLVDVRAPAEFEVSHLRGAHNAPSGRELRALKSIPEDRPIVVYCSVGYRSAQAARTLEAAGFASVRNYLGSIFEWANQGLPIVDSKGPATKVHPYDAHWGQLLRPELR